jgi:hypothetical protein
VGTGAGSFKRVLGSITEQPGTFIPKQTVKFE